MGRARITLLSTPTFGRVRRQACAWSLAALLGVLGVVSPFPALAGPEPERATLDVALDKGAEGCADRAKLTKLVEGVAGANAIAAPGKTAPTQIQVRIRRVDKGYSATVSLSGAQAGERVIEDAGPRCAALSQALAVAIAVLIDAESNPPVDVPPPPPKKPPPTPPPPVEPPLPPRPPEPRIVPVTTTAGAVYDFGTLDGSAGGFNVSLETYIPILSFGFAFVALPHAPRERLSSTAVFRFLAGRVRICTRQPYLELFGASFCLGFLGGERRVSLATEGKEGTTNGGYVAAAIQLEVSRRVVGPFGLFVDMGVGLPFIRQTLEVVVPGNDLRLQEEGEAVTFQMGAGVRFWLGD